MITTKYFADQRISTDYGLYQYWDVKLEWSVARDFCHAMAGHLVAFPSKPSYLALLGLITPQVDKLVWIGAGRASVSQPLFWEHNKEDVTVTNWHQTQPMFALDTENCVIYSQLC